MVLQALPLLAPLGPRRAHALQALYLLLFLAHAGEEQPDVLVVQSLPGMVGTS